MMTPLPVHPSLVLQVGFVLLGISLVIMLALALRSGRFLFIGSIWLGFTAYLGSTGILSDFSSVPPNILLLFLPGFAGALILGFTKIGGTLSRLPMGFLVGYQAFRIVVEILIHKAAQEGVAPPQMSWSGMNFDIVSGISALLLFPFVKRIPKWALLFWNAFSLCLLIWVVGVALLSFPSIFQKLKPDNIWIAHFPFIWLPMVAVTSALIGHVAVFRKILRKQEGS